jgi:DNA-binding NtrC family response regulator
MTESTTNWTAGLPGADDSTLSRGDPSPHDAVVTAYLLVFEGASSTVVDLPLDGDVVIGRGDAAHVRLFDGSVSRAHARISMAGGRAEIVDLGSQNGTKVNGERIVGARPLLSGDVVTILEATLVFHASSREGPRRPMLALDGFRQHVEDEIDRLARNRRGFGLAAIALAAGDADAAPRAFDPIAVSRVVEPALRRIDAIALVGSELLVVMPEADLAAARELARGLVERLRAAAARPCGGLALAPGDGNDFELLLIAARAARDRAAPGEVGLASETYRVIALDDRELIAADPAMLRVVALLERLSATDLPVLICGETGTGKDLAAAALHRASARASRPLVAARCAALPEAAAELELFGRAADPATGAAPQPGVLEQSDGGTVFLDEVGELSLAVQARLLRALETRRITRIGGTAEIAIDLRVVAATHRDLTAEVKAGRFRQDLLFRIGGATVWLPPLRDRRREIPILAQRFLADACRRTGREAMAISGEAMQLLLDFAWPGNVRELRHVVDYAAAANDEPVIAAWHLIDRLSGDGRGRSPASRDPAPRDPPRPPPGGFVPIDEEIREIERTRMSQALAAANGNQTAAAELIKMPLRTFQAKAKVYGLRHKDRR